MKRMIVLCGTDKNIAREPEWYGDIRLAYFLRDGPYVLRTKETRKNK